jgi:phosphatidylinositol alpha-1,6-mannosyltransferase
VNSLLLAPDLFSEEGGISRMLRLYLKGLCELSGAGETVRFVSLNDATISSGDLARYSTPALGEWEACRRSKARFSLSAAKMGAHSDRIICGHVGQLPVAWLASRLGRRPAYYLVAHGIEVWRPFTRLERWSLAGASRILCVSEFTRKQVLGRCRLDPLRTVVLPNALDPFLGAESDPRPAGGPPVVLALSRLSKADNYKGIGHLVAAMPAVRAAVPGARLRVVGRGDGLPGLQELAHRQGVADVVEFAGFRSDAELREDFARCSLFALPSEREGFGLVYLEAMAHGRPCLGARSGGVPEVINDDSGVLVEYGDVPGIAAGIVAALSRDWSTEALVGRAREFSYLRFKDRLASLLHA